MIITYISGGPVTGGCHSNKLYVNITSHFEYKMPELNNFITRTHNRMCEAFVVIIIAVPGYRTQTSEDGMWTTI